MTALLEYFVITGVTLGKCAHPHRLAIVIINVHWHTINTLACLDFVVTNNFSTGFLKMVGTLGMPLTLALHVRKCDAAL